MDPKHGTAEVGRPVKTYPKLLTEDTGVHLADLPNAMDNRELWREIVNSVQATPQYDDDDTPYSVFNRLDKFYMIVF